MGKYSHLLPQILDPFAFVELGTGLSLKEYVAESLGLG